MDRALTIAIVGALSLLLPGYACGTTADTFVPVDDAPDDEDIPFEGPPGEAPTGQRYDEVEVQDGCGRTLLAFRLVDEICGNATADSAVLAETSALAAPMFRDGAIVDDVLYAVDGTHLWTMDAAALGVSDPARLALTAGVGQALAVVAEATGVLIAAGDAGLLEVTATDGTIAATVRASLPGPALDVALDGDGGAVVAMGNAGLALASGAIVDVGGPAVAVTIDGALAYVATCDGLAIVDVASGVVLGSARGASWIAPVDGVNHAPAKDVAIAHDGDRSIAFVAAGRYGAVAVDVTDASAPALLGNCTDATNPAHYVSGVKLDAARGLLAIAAGERGVVVERDLAACTTTFTAPGVRDAVSTVDGACVPRPPWEILPLVSWEPPPPARDPVQVLMHEGLALAFGDARRNALRAIDVWAVPDALDPEADGALVHVGRYEEPRLLEGIAVGGPPDAPVLVVTGKGGARFTLDPSALLVRVPLTLDGTSLRGMPALLADGTVVTLVSADEAHETSRVLVHRAADAGGVVEVAIEGRASPRALAVRADGTIVIGRDGGTAALDPITNAVTLSSFERATALAPSLAVLGDDVVIAAPEWDRAMLVGRGDLAPHGGFDADEILDLDRWRFGPPRRTLASNEDDTALLELATLGDRAALLVHARDDVGSFAVACEGPVPAAPYIDTALVDDGTGRGRAFLLAHDPGRYRSELMTIDLSGATPLVLAVDGFSGAGVGVVAYGTRVYVADADGEVRVYDAGSTGGARLLGVVDVRGAQ